MRKILLSGLILLALLLIVTNVSAPGECTQNETISCGSDVGVCEPGIRHCVNGSWGECLGEVGPSTETCNGLDDDCDETIDEDCVECTDSDEGDNYYVKGQCTQRVGTGVGMVSDLCADEETLKECYCENNSLKYVNYTCPYGCNDGACLEEPECTNDEECPSSIEYYCSDSYSCTRTKYYSCIEGECVVIGEGGGCGPCPHGCRDGNCIEEECVGEGGSLGPVIPENTIQCCPGLTQISAATYYEGTCQVLIGSRGYCTYCGDGVCKRPENPCNCPKDCVEARCPVMIDLIFNKHDYFPNDYFEVMVKIYDEGKNLIPNQAFNVYNTREGTTATYYTDSTGIWKETSTVPSDPKYEGEWTFVASVSREGCSYISDKETIYIHMPTECGDGFCSEDEKHLVCETVCPEVASATIATSVTGAMTATAYPETAVTQELTSISEMPIRCVSYCHVKCPRDCTPECGNGVCDKEVCEREGCPIPEDERNCPQDCRHANYCGSRSTDPNCICQEGYRKEVFEAPCEGQEPVKECAVDSDCYPEGFTPGECGPFYECSGGKCYAGSGACPPSTTGMITGIAEVVKIGHRNAYWQCYDGEEKYEDDPSCIAAETWKRHAEEFCRGRCNGYGKCGVNSFRVWNDCMMEGRCYDSDGGKNYYVKGVVEGKDKYGNEIRIEDACSNSLTRLDDVYEGRYLFEAYCVDGGIGEREAYECPNGCRDGACVKEMRICRYYRCVPEYKDLYLSTDKYSYDLNEPVEIRTNPVPEEHLDVREIKVSVRDPYGDEQPVTLNAVCETGGGICPKCEPGYYCAPCTTKNLCYFKGTYTETGSVGIYQVGKWVETGDLIIRPTSFRVIDYSLLEKYLILRDIDGYVYKDSQLSPGPYKNVMGYMAHYVKDGRDYAVIVADFENREDLEEFLKTVLGQMTPREKQIDGYYIYVFETYGQKVYIWTYKTFLIGVMEHMPVAVTAQIARPVPVEVPTKQAVGGAIPMEEVAIAGTPQKAPEFLTGMVTGMPIAEATPVYCGMDSLYPQCVCKGDEIKEEFTPQCFNPPCETHYRCRIKEPTELIKAYLDKYPSDIKAAGTECERKGGYCIDMGSSCRSEFLEVGFACKTNAEKCCIKEVDRDDFLEIVMKLEGIRVRMDRLERRARALSDYYNSVGDENRSEKFSDVADMFARAKQMIDDIVAKIRANLNNLEGIRSEVKGDIQELRRYISSILERMVS